MFLESILVRDSMDRSRSITEVENRTQHHVWGLPSPVEAAEGSYASLSAKMSGCASSFAGLELRVKVLHSVLDAISTYQLPQHVVYEKKEYPNDLNLAADQLVDLVKGRLKMQEAHVLFLSRRGDVQLTAASIIFSVDPVRATSIPIVATYEFLAKLTLAAIQLIIAQKEARISIAVAEDSRTIASASKEDSSAMRTLAAVTVVFLPGTLVAALFAMPWFQWDAEHNSSSMSSQFWIYWAVTVPLTFLIVGSWITRTRTMNSRHKVQDCVDRKKLWNAIDDARTGTAGDNNV